MKIMVTKNLKKYRKRENNDRTNWNKKKTNVNQVINTNKREKNKKATMKMNGVDDFSNLPSFQGFC